MVNVIKFVNGKSLALLVFCCALAPRTVAAQAPTPTREGIPTLSGYMEMHLNKVEDLPAEVDLHRFVLMGTASRTA